MGSPATLKIDIIADVSKAAAAMDGVDSKLSGLGKAFTGAAIVGGVAVAGKAVLDLGKQMVGAAEEGRALSGATEQLIKTTGGAANVSTKHVEDMANALARSTGVSDDSIQSAQNMLLTFTAVGNAADDGTGAFDRATAAALDLAAAGFGTVESNATQLGKALQDPEKGLAALSKSGVTFTEQQKEQIAVMQASGDLLGAQEIVLAAVEGQVKGTAEASATSSAKMGVAWEQAQETIGNALLPIIDELLPVFMELLDALIPAVMPVVKVIADLASTLIRSLMPAIQPILPVLGELAGVIGGVLSEVFRILAPLLPPIITALMGIVKAAVPLIPPLLKIATAMTPMLPLFADLIVLAAELATAVLPLLTPILNLLAGIMGKFSAALKVVSDALRTLIEWARKAIDALSKIKIPKLPGSGLIGKLNPFMFTPQMAAAGATTMAASGRGAVHQTLKVDVTGVGFDSILTGRALSSQISRWQQRNGLSPVQWAERNGGMKPGPA